MKGFYETLLEAERVIVKHEDMYGPGAYNLKPEYLAGNRFYRTARIRIRVKAPVHMDYMSRWNWWHTCVYPGFRNILFNTSVAVNRTMWKQHHAPHKNRKR